MPDVFMPSSGERPLGLQYPPSGGYPPPPGGGYPPPGGGYPPQGPPPGGGYPPQGPPPGGGYPPQGPPPGGGYPPQGPPPGGGYPPQGPPSGGGYPPQGGPPQYGAPPPADPYGQPQGGGPPPPQGPAAKNTAWYLWGALAGVLLALIFVLIFWKLFYPSLARDAALAAIDPGALQSSNVDALQAEIEAYRAALAGDVCVAPPLADAAPLFRHKTPPPQAPGEGGEAGSGKGAAPAEPPANLPPPLNPTAGDEVESATVLVISIGPSDSGTGTGFFINDRQLLTNRHVVEGALRGGKVAITSKILGGLLECEILAVTDENEVLRDYALLQVTGARAHASLRFSDRAKRSERVGAWGYPAINTELDPSMKALLGGDVTSAPEVVYTEGVISVVQRAQGLPPFISHTAEVSHGNSGGPLVNGAGEVLGINTAIRTDKESNRQVNIAVASEDVMEFLRANGVSFDLSADAT